MEGFEGGVDALWGGGEAEAGHFGEAGDDFVAEEELVPVGGGDLLEELGEALAGGACGEGGEGAVAAVSVEDVEAGAADCGFGGAPVGEMGDEADGGREDGAVAGGGQAGAFGRGEDEPEMGEVLRGGDLGAVEEDAEGFRLVVGALAEPVGGDHDWGQGLGHGAAGGEEGGEGGGVEQGDLVGVGAEDVAVPAGFEACGSFVDLVFPQAAYQPDFWARIARGRRRRGGRSGWGRGCWRRSRAPSRRRRRRRRRFRLRAARWKRGRRGAAPNRPSGRHRR